jgi:hypothetical protein
MENALPRGLLDEVMSPGEEGKRALAKALKEMIASELAISAGLVVPTRCPHCGGEHIVRKGRDAGGNQRFLCIIIGFLLDDGGQDNHLFDSESGMVSLTVAIVVEFLFHTLHELLRRDCPEEFVSVLENKIKTVERNIEVVVHQLTVEILIELLRGAEFADGEADGVLLPVAEFSDEREFIHVRVNDIGARTDTLVKSQDICHEAECRRSIKAVAKGLEGGALGEVDATGLGVGGRGFQKGNSS